MDTLEKTLLTKASGDQRYNPHQQKKYLGTFAERVILTGTFEEITSDNLEQILDLVKTLSLQYTPAYLKLNAELSINWQMAFRQLANTAKLPVTVVEEEEASSPYAFVLHSDRALYLSTTDVTTFLPVIQAPKPAKKSFWQSILGNR